MPQESSPFLGPRKRLNEILARAVPLERDGFPFGSLHLRNLFEEEARAGQLESAEAVVERAGALLALAEHSWAPLRRLLSEFDGLRDLAEAAGMDLGKVDAQTGNPRAVLLRPPISEATLEATERSVQVGLTTLREALPPYLVEQARSLGRWAREAEARDEEIGEIATEVRRVVQGLHDLDLRSAAGAVGAARRAIARRAGPTGVPSVPVPEEEAILLEAHSLARRLPWHDPLSREHRSGPGGGLDGSGGEDGEAGVISPEAEVDALWAEVDRLVRERELAATGPLLAVAGPSLTVSPPVEIPAIAQEASAPTDTHGSEVPPLGDPPGTPAMPAPQFPARAEPAVADGPSPREVSPPEEAIGDPTGRWLPAGALLEEITVSAGAPEEATDADPLSASSAGLSLPAAKGESLDAPPTAVAAPSERAHLAEPSSPSVPGRASPANGTPRTVGLDPDRARPPRWMSRISISAAYVPPEPYAPGTRRAPRPQRQRPRRARSRHRR